MITDMITINVADSVESAPKYEESVKLLKPTKAIIVPRGTIQVNLIVDIQMVDSEGNKYLIMATAGIIESLGAAVAGVRTRTTGN